MNAVDHVVLGLLAEGPDHGYALRRRLETALFAPVTIGRVYDILNRLEREELVTAVLERVGRRGRRVYTLLPAGRRVLDRLSAARRAAAARTGESRP